MRLQVRWVAGPALTLLVLGVLVLATGESRGGAERERCRGLVATIVGTSGNDRLEGTSGRDVMAGLDGSDRIQAGPGRDVVCGGRGSDLLRGFRGHDLMIGGKSVDLIYGRSGDDRLLGRRGRDLLNGGRGWDVCRGGRPRDDGAPDQVREGDVAEEGTCERITSARDDPSVILFDAPSGKGR